MKLHVWKNPSSGTRAEVREVADDAPAPTAPWEEMTIEAFVAWRDAQPAIEPMAEIPTVSRRKLFRVLNARGITRSALRARLMSIPNDKEREDALIDFDEAQEFDRRHRLVLSFGEALELSESDIDGIFREAAAMPDLT